MSTRKDNWQGMNWTYERAMRLLDLCRERYLIGEITFEDKCAREDMIYVASGWTGDELWTECCRRLDVAIAARRELR